MRASPSSTGGLKTCPRSVPQTVCSAPTARVAAKTSLPRALARVRRGERALHQRAALGQRHLVVGRDALRRELGVGDDDRLDARVDGRVDDGEDLVARRWPVASTRSWRATTSSTSSSSGSGAPSASTTGTGRGAHARLAQLELEAHPDRHLAVRVGVLDLAELVLGADGGEPDDPRALRARRPRPRVAFSPPTAWLSVIVPSAVHARAPPR